MEKEIEEFKKDFEKATKMETLMREIFFDEKTREKHNKQERIKMLDLRTKILYGERYLKIFCDNFGDENTAEAEKKYNVARINLHLEKILEEYTKLTDELDQIIFKEEKEDE